MKYSELYFEKFNDDEITLFAQLIGYFQANAVKFIVEDSNTCIKLIIESN
jgi:hypothetical protein|tara:strand:+ start:107 stop:256 length:150 start_codon:yes stop_codon:yes gene_type:complete